MNDISETSGVTATAAPPPPANHETEVKNTEISAQDRSVVIEMKFISLWLVADCLFLSYEQEGLAV
jgi:hypothetical protein